MKRALLLLIIVFGFLQSCEDAKESIEPNSSIYQLKSEISDFMDNTENSKTKYTRLIAYLENKGLTKVAEENSRNNLNPHTGLYKPGDQGGGGDRPYCDSDLFTNPDGTMLKISECRLYDAEFGWFTYCLVYTYYNANFQEIHYEEWCWIED